MKKVNIIAEAGSNHNGEIEEAKKLIDVATMSGADYVKFQIINPELLYLPGKYWYGPYDSQEVIKLRERFKLSEEEYIELYEYSQFKNIKFTASVFDKKGADFLSKLNPDFIKVASTDLNNLSLLRHLAEKGKRLIISTGMATLGEIEKSVSELYRINFVDIVLMHCVSVYPAKLENMNLSFLDTLKTAFGFPIGLSDHTKTNIAACIAISKGVDYIEKHFTLNSNKDGFDHKHALEPDQLKNFVDDIRKSEKSLISPVSKLIEEELEVKKRARRSIYAGRNIKKNEIISEDDLLIVRPENILSADYIDFVIGKKAIKAISKHEPIKLENLT